MKINRAAFGLSIRLALRDLSGGLQGFRIFIACMAIGVAAITGVYGIVDALTSGLNREARTILGGDMAFSMPQREANAEELQFLRSRGTAAAVANMRSMARRETGPLALVEMKAVDAAYPAIGQLMVKRGDANSAARATELAPRADGTHGAFLDPVLAARLDLKLGDTFALGGARLHMAAEIVSEPDKLGVGIGFAPRLLVSQDALRASGLMQPGALIRWTYRVILPAGANGDAALDLLSAEAQAAFPEAGWEIRSRRNASPQFARNLDRFAQFLTLVGLTALLIGGVGVANAARSFVERKRPDLATLKSLGATGHFVFMTAFLEVLAMALLGSVIGVAIGLCIPVAVKMFAGPLIPFPLAPAFTVRGAASGLGFGLATALAFAVWPLARVHDIPVSALFRDGVDHTKIRPRARYIIAGTVFVLALAGIAIGLAFDRRIAAYYVGIAAVTFLLLRIFAGGAMRLMARLPRRGSTEMRMALANFHRPGAATPSVILSLGLGLTLLVALAVVDSNLRNQLARGVSGQTPSFFFVDIPNADIVRFAELINANAPGSKLERTPMMRGRIMALNGVGAEAVKADQQAAWVLEGDRGITFAELPPADSVITSGAWWPAAYRGEPLVSFENKLAAGLGLKVGDAVTVNVLGRNLTARIANLRTVDWQTMGINFVMIFSPNTFAGAPHTHLATVGFKMPMAARDEVSFARAIADAFPAVTSVRVKDALQAVADVMDQLGLAIRAATGIAIAACILVLGGALGAGQSARTHEAVVLKTLGATRRRLIRAYTYEYGLLGLISAGLGLLLGVFASFLVVTQLMNLEFDPSWGAAGATAATAVALTIALGLIGTWRILGQKPASHLRNL